MNECRVILFGVVDPDGESILDIINAFFPKDLIALSDDCIKEIDDKLCFAAGGKLDDKIKAVLRGAEINAIQEDKQSFQTMLENSSGGHFEIWRKQYRRQMKRSIQLDSIRNAEMLIGLHELFARIPGVRVILANIDPFQIEAKEAKMLSLYFETVNDKTDTTRRLNYAIIPDIDIREEFHSRGGRFLGNDSQTGNALGNKHEEAKPLLEILGEHGIRAFCQYNTTQEASFTAFSARGYDAFLKIAREFESEKFAKWVCACYPNLSSEFDGFYIGAAYAAVISMESGVGEGEETGFPRELDVMEPRVRAEAESERRDFCFYNSDRKHMVVLSRRNCSREKI